MKCVIDTNGLLRSIPKSGDYRWLFDAWRQNKFVWVISNEILTEYVEVITSEYSLKAAELVSELLLTAKNHLRIEPSYKWQLIVADPDDNKFVDCAVAAQADYLVSNDHHILALTRINNLFPPVPVITFDEFKKILALP